ncbi:MAG TPA: DedA family protein/thiosulfate sulfurtransferase GlpE [Casimicrobiaceae bacterium]|jgi:membrane protein DedA with SNARE-associated domain/rhodanese-related sulfurtransferase|nr:DedA family protein/thiosulfate sulfurtransferase GlpE [Casimicrobiaceae bacterium]
MVGLITQYGLALVFANVLMQQMGLPIPALPTLIVAGALAAEGKISALALFGVVFIACTISDATWYTVGRVFGRRVMKLLCQMSLSPESCVRQSEHLFHRWGGLTLVLGKFVPGLLTISPAMAGTMRLSGWSFALLDGLSAAIWAGVAIGLGMLFHREIAYLLGNLQELGTIAIAVIGVALGGYIAARWWQRRRFYNRLGVARIGADELHRLIAEGQRPVIVDLRTPLARDRDSRFIPNALVADLAEVNQWLDQVPRNREIIFYCTCPNEAGAASVARKLMDLGYTHVRPLLGGLDAWIAAGYEVENGSGGPSHRAPTSGTAVRISDETRAMQN